MNPAAGPPTRISVDTRPPDVERVPVWIALGDSDDHLRLTALIASHVRSQLGGSALEDAIDACTRPDAVWSARYDAIAFVLDRWMDRVGASPVAALFDVDALDPGKAAPEKLWDDRTFVRQRKQFLDLLMHAFRRGGWVLIRPRPSADMSIELGEVAEPDVIESPPSSDAKVDALLELLAPDSRPLLTWLLEREILDLNAVDRMLDVSGTEGFEQELIEVVYEALPASAREAAKRLSTLRHPQPLNGALGPFRLLNGADDHFAPVLDGSLELGGRAVRALRESGVLQPYSPGTARMPRALRRTLAALAERSMPDAIEAVHRSLAAQDDDAAPLDQRLELHFHAVRGGDLERAIATARWYAGDLRELGYRWSRARRYDDAAAVYRAIVERFDREDAYAWEYLGYNLALACGDEPSVQCSAEILNAYRTAFNLERSNPLYQGRLLGFRASRGEDVEIDFQRGMKRHLNEWGRTEAASYFAEPVLKGMLRGGSGRRVREVVGSWLPLLRRFERLRPLLGFE